MIPQSSIDEWRATAPWGSDLQIENFSVLGYQERPFQVVSGWFTGSAIVRTYALNELLGTKVRALYQRKKGRDAAAFQLVSERLIAIIPG